MKQTHSKYPNVPCLIAHWFGTGFLPKAPGTWGSLATLPLAYCLMWIGGFSLLLICIPILFLLGTWASVIILKRLKNPSQKDPSSIVIDEVVGQLIALLPAGLDWRLWLLAFILFRFFDIVKIWPACWVERNMGGSTRQDAIGIMLDDVVAGVYSALIVIGIACIW
ncbi:MAG: phosphatidylglycerophosphatase A [Alphaproteobacteria bacterium]|nr:phosphatidylglycerophosphatase A [Alphaproteobacteria bacterium]MBT5390450.1 phosphatidylglycerophosphatase A [Alphaproteobacteria bacterium]MBT5654732.1 phosphatidylglycerophosphatase A [Alphaproteobacteria bacterium]